MATPFPVKTGLDVLLSGSLRRLRGARIGVLSHQASVDSRLRHLIPLLRGRDLQLTALFAPEHGLWGMAQDQVPVKAARHPTLNVPVSSLYGETRAPTSAMLKGIDVLICDLQDVGSRYYTFIWTLALVLQACARDGKRLIVLDRPNPLGGVELEGPVLDPAFASFVGLYALPVRHGLTIGEVARWINGTYGVGADLEVVPMRGWRRRMLFEQTGLPWVLPSPNMPTVETAAVYPGACLIEGTNLSEGRGTTRPFEIVGAPYINPDTLARRLNEERLPGVRFRALRFEPTFQKYAGDACGGVQVHLTDRARFKPFMTYLHLISRAYGLYPRQFAWRRPPYEYEKKRMPFDILCGTDRIRLAIERGEPLAALERAWRGPLEAFARGRIPFLLYN